MRRIGIVSLSLILAVCCSSAAIAQVVHIDFDTASGGAPVSNGTVVNTLYASYGVTFDAVRCAGCGTDPSVYANSNCLINGPISPPNVVTLFGITTCSDIAENALGLVRATFFSLMDSVCIRVKPVRSTDFAVLHAFNTADVEIATAYSTAGTTQDVCITAAGIKKVTFSGSGLNFAWFDDLVFRVESTTPTTRHTWGGIKTLYR